MKLTDAIAKSPVGAAALSWRGQYRAIEHLELMTGDWWFVWIGKWPEEKAGKRFTCFFEMYRDAETLVDEQGWEPLDTPPIRGTRLEFC